MSIEDRENGIELVNCKYAENSFVECVTLINLYEQSNEFTDCDQINEMPETVNNVTQIPQIRKEDLKDVMKSGKLIIYDKNGNRVYENNGAVKPESMPTEWDKVERVLSSLNVSLEEQLKMALSQENYELAAEITNEIAAKKK